MHTLVTDRKRQGAARKALLRTFRKGAEKSVNTFKSPGGSYNGATTYFRPDLGIWGAIGEGAGSILAFGVGRPDWQIGIEIKIPAGRTLHSSGQLVEDSSGRLLLAHQGGLGGGKFSVDRQTFAILIRNFVRTTVMDQDVDRAMFVIADVERASDMAEVAAYVKEAEHIREIRRAQGNDYAAWALRAAARKAGIRENEDEGVYDRAARVEFKRLHGIVQNALADTVHAAGYENDAIALTGGLRADLVVKREGAGFLFEIKASTGAQPHFTAIGQLLVYGHGHRAGLRKVVVTPGMPGSDLFAKALAALGIETLEYEIVGRDVRFSGLDLMIA